MALGSEIRDPEKNYSGSRIQGSKRHQIPDPDPGSGSATLVQSHNLWTPWRQAVKEMCTQRDSGQLC